MFCEANKSTRGFVTCCDDVYCSSANDAGFPIFKPPRRAGRANRLLSRSLGAHAQARYTVVCLCVIVNLLSLMSIKHLYLTYLNPSTLNLMIINLQLTVNL